MADLTGTVEEQQKQAVYDALHRSDLGVARVTEDLIYLLIQKNVILFTELPEIVQKKLLSREELRDKLSGPSMSPISEDDTL